MSIHQHDFLGRPPARGVVPVGVSVAGNGSGGPRPFMKRPSDQGYPQYCQVLGTHEIQVIEYRT